MRRYKGVVMIIPFSDKYRINSDKHGWFIQEFKGNQLDKRDGQVKPVWMGIKWYSTFEKCLQQAAAMTIQTSSADTPSQVLNEIENTHSQLRNALDEYKELLKFDMKIESI